MTLQALRACSSSFAESENDEMTLFFLEPASYINCVKIDLSFIVKLCEEVMTKSNPFSLKNYDRPVLEAPNGAKEILLHSCCAPCAGEVMLAIKATGIRQTVFFYNPNIHPHEEYELRKNENKRFCDAQNIAFIDADYDTDNWFERVKGLENEPERGKRCTACFDMRFERTALHAHEHNISLISSTLGISRWKDMDQVTSSGMRAANRYDDVTYWTYNWRKRGGGPRMVELAKQEQFYQQEYCGCVYSLRDTNRHRLANNRDRIKRLTKFYGAPACHSPDIIPIRDITGETDKNL